MVYTNQAKKLSVSETSFFSPIFADFAKILVVSKIKGVGYIKLQS